MSDQPGEPTAQNEEPEGTFLRARFAGGRFDSHSIPFEVLPDLAAYRSLIIEVAKMLYKRRNNSRARVPKGFGDSFQLGLVQVKGGHSAVAYAARTYPSGPADMQASMLLATYPEFEEARVYVEDLIKHVGKVGTVPDDFPVELAGRFNPFGQSLNDDEYVEISHGGLPAARYSNIIRKNIVLSREATYEGAVDGIFKLNGGLYDSGTIHVLDEAGISYDFRPLTETEFVKAMNSGAVSVRLTGMGLYDRDEKLRRLIAVSVIYDDERPQLACDLRLDEISTAETGWFDGENPAPSPSAIALMRQFVASILQIPELPEPYLYPTPDGGVAAEWSINGWEASVTCPVVGKMITIHALNISTSDEIYLQILSTDDALKSQFLSIWKILLEGRSNASN